MVSQALRPLLPLLPRPVMSWEKHETSHQTEDSSFGAARGHRQPSTVSVRMAPQDGPSQATHTLAHPLLLSGLSGQGQPYPTAGKAVKPRHGSPAHCPLHRGRSSFLLPPDGH